MGSIGDIFLRLLADDSKLTGEVTKAAQKAGDAGSATLGKSMAKGFATTAVQGFGVAASAAFGLAAKGALELENIQVDLQRETGLTAEEAKKAATAINGIAGRNVANLQDVSAAFAKVHNDLGLTGDAANAATEAFIKFGRATNMNAADAVSGFDDVLDAWNLTAADSQKIMDQLVVSHQKYGGSVQDNLTALGKLAPQMQALGATTDDTIALLNLFAASGIDASKATAALNTAVTKLKPGQSLDDLIKQISAIEDPTLRAQKAVEIFGAKGGVALANALKPGVDSLSDYAVTAEESAGATEKASDAIDSSFSGKVRKAISEATAALRGFGQEFGPALTGLASLSTLAATVFPGVGTKLAGGILGGLKGIGKKIVGAIGTQTAAAAVSTAGGEAIGEALGKSVTKGLGARGIASAIADKIGGALSSVPGSSAFGKGIGAINGALKSKIGTGIAVTVAVTAVIEVVQEYGKLQQQVTDDLNSIAQHAQEQLKSSTSAALQVQKNALTTGIQQLDEWSKHDPIGAWVAGADRSKAELQKQLDATVSELNRRGVTDGEEIGKSFGEGYAAGVGPTTAAAAAAAGKDASKSFAGGAVDGAKQYAPTVRDGMNRLGEDAFGHQTFAQKLWAKGKDAILSFAQGIRDARQEPLDAMDALKEAMKHPLTRMAEATRLAGQLASKELAAGMKSNDPAIRAQAHATEQIIVDRLKALVKQGAPIGRDSMEALRKAMKSKDKDIARAATDIYQTIKSRLSKAKPAAHDVGVQAGKNVASGLRSQQGSIYAAAFAVARRIANALFAGVKSTTGGGGGGSGGTKEHRAGGGPVEALQTYVIGETGRELFIPDQSGYIVPNDVLRRLSVPKATGWDGAMAPPAPSGPATVIQHYNIPLPGIVEVRTAEDIVRPLRQLASVGTFERDKRFVTANRRPVR